MAISFVSSDEDREVLKQVESRFSVPLPEYPVDGIDAKDYMVKTD